MRNAAVGLVVLVAAVGCSSGSSGKPPTVVTTIVTRTTPAPAPTSLMVDGVGPGVNETFFYPTTTVTAVACGAAPGGTFVEVAVPAGGPPTPASSALAEPTTAIVVPGRAVLKDHTGKILYEQDLGSIATSSAGGFVLSMTNVTYIGGDRRTVEAGAVDIAGNFACPAARTPFPGI